MSKAAVNAEVDRFLEDELSLRLKKKLRRKAELARASLSCLEVPRPFRDYPPPDIVYYGALRKANIAKHVSEDHEKRKARTMPGSERARAEKIFKMKAMKESMLAEDGDAETREARELSYASGELFKALDTDGSGELSREEMANGAPLLGLGVHEALVLFDKLDVDKSGMVRTQPRSGIIVMAAPFLLFCNLTEQAQKVPLKISYFCVISMAVMLSFNFFLLTSPRWTLRNFSRRLPKWKSSRCAI